MIASRVEPLEEVIDSMRLVMEDHHIERLQSNECSVQSGISLKEILNSTDRIAGHCVNISVFLVQRLNDPHKFDAHQHLMQDHQEMTEEYHGLYSYYEKQYLEPLRIVAVEEKKAREEQAAEQLIEQIEALTPEETKSKIKDASKKKEKLKKKEKDVKKDKKKSKDGKNEK
jgi:phosphate:Na+ symporter